MKKRKLLVLGLIALVLVGGLVLASCRISKCEEYGGCKAGINEFGHYVSHDYPNKCIAKQKEAVGESYGSYSCNCD
jgi:hypothetical protein